MKKILSLSLLSIAAMLLPTRAHAQVLCALGPVTPYDPMADMPPSAGAKADLTKVTSLLCGKGCGKVLLFANATTPNTATVTDGAGVSKISYSPSFASSVRSNFGPIAMFGIFAHDLGHHLDATGNQGGLDEGFVGQRAARRRVGRLRDREGRHEPVAPPGRAAGDVDVSVATPPGVGCAAIGDHGRIHPVRRPAAAAAGQGKARAGRQDRRPQERHRRRGARPRAAAATRIAATGAPA